jgi:hypothetical protein
VTAHCTVDRRRKDRESGEGEGDREREIEMEGEDTHMPCVAFVFVQVCGSVLACLQGNSARLPEF